jgi:hypothetical protein
VYAIRVLDDCDVLNRSDICVYDTCTCENCCVCMRMSLCVGVDRVVGVGG